MQKYPDNENSQVQNNYFEQMGRVDWRLKIIF